MAFRVFFACDVIGCKKTSDEITRSSPGTMAAVPQGWRVLFDKINHSQFTYDDFGYTLCPEHAKLFPEPKQQISHEAI